MHRDLRNTMIWLVLATSMVILAFWQAQLAVTKEAQAALRTPPPPSKTCHAVRATLAKLPVDPVADYIARCTKGTSDQKIGWIIRDFRTAGLDIDLLGPESGKLSRESLIHRQDEFFVRRATEQRWYRDALVDGLNLSTEQSTQVTLKLNERLDRAKADFIEASNSSLRVHQVNGKWTADDFTKSVRDLIDPLSWAFKNEGFQAWELTHLTPTQEEITWKTWFEKSSDPQTESLLQSSDPPNQENPSLSFLLPYPLINRDETRLADHEPLTDFQTVNAIFPFLKTQKFANATLATSPSDLLAHLRALHPAQLKILLLFDPKITQEILSLLDHQP